MKKTPPFFTIVPVPITVNIVDIGANPIDGEPPYFNLLKTGRAKVIGFEPYPEALEKLNKSKGNSETYLPFAIGDGKVHNFNTCKAEGMSSLLEPDPDVLDNFHDFKMWGEIKKTTEIQTVRLDDIDDIEDLDYLKIDIQGGELLAFENGLEKLSDCLVIQSEVEFLSMYKNQPLFSEVEMFLRDQNLLFHRFFPLTSRIVKPLILDSNTFGGLSQAMYADAVFVRNFMELSKIKTHKLLKMATILHDVYCSFDIVLRILMEYDLRQKTNWSEPYHHAILNPTMT